jgi:cell division septum initiation protein DivIVA
MYISPELNKARQDIKDLQMENEQLKNELAELKREVEALQVADKPKTTKTVKAKTTKTEETPVVETNTEIPTIVDDAAPTEVE